MRVLALALISVSLVLALLGTARIVGLDFPLAGVSEAPVDGLFASRKPRNPVGWFFLAGACIGGLQSVAGAYAVYGLVVDPGSPGRPRRVVREDVPENRADLRVRPAAPATRGRRWSPSPPGCATNGLRGPERRAAVGGEGENATRTRLTVDAPRGRSRRRTPGLTKECPPACCASGGGSPTSPGGLPRIIRSIMLRVGNTPVPIPLRGTIFRHREAPGGHSFSPIRASLRSSAIPLWPCFSDWEIPFS